MFHIKVSLFALTKSLENKIDLFHDKIIDAAMTFKKAIRVFLNEKRSENYRKLSKQIKTIEHDADALRHGQALHGSEPAARIDETGPAPRHRKQTLYPKPDSRPARRRAATG